MTAMHIHKDVYAICIQCNRSKIPRLLYMYFMIGPKTVLQSDNLSSHTVSQETDAWG
jgi:hypothetical protein